jgi:hypothetical protein
MTRGWERLIARNPLNALPAPAKQDVILRGWYVQGTNTLIPGASDDVPIDCHTAEARHPVRRELAGKTMNVSGSWIIRFRG